MRDTSGYSKFLLAIGLFFSVQSFALTEKSIVESFVKFSPELQSAKATYMASAEKVKEARATLLPSVNLVAAHSRNELPTAYGGAVSKAHSRSAGLSISQPVYLGGKVWNAFSIAKQSKKLAVHNYQTQKQQLIFQVLQLSYQLGAYQNKLKVLKSSQKIQKQFLDIAKKRSRRGNAKKFEYAQALAQYQSYIPRLIQMGQLVESTKTSLQSLLGTSSPVNYELNSSFDEKLSKRPISLLLEEAISNRSDYKAALMSVELAKTQKSFNMAEHRPQLSINYSKGYLADDWGKVGKDPSKTNALSVNLVVPLFSGFSSVNVRRHGQYNVYAAEKSLAGAKLNLKSDLENTVRVHNAALSGLKQTGFWAKNAKKALSEGVKSYRKGAITTAQLNQLQTGEEMASNSEVDAILSCNMSSLTMKMKLGKDLEAEYTGQNTMSIR